MPVKWYGPEVMERARHSAMMAVEAGAIVLQTAIKKNLGKGGSSNRSNEGRRIGGKDLAVGTGNLRRSIQFSPVHADGLSIKTRVGTNTKYAKVHEFGGVIVAKGKTLTIPIHKKAKAAAAAGQSARQAFPDAFAITLNGKAFLVRDPGKGKNKITRVAKKTRPTVMRNVTFGNRSKSGTSISTYHIRDGKNIRKIELLYQLIRSVRIPPRPYFRPAVQEVSANIRQRVASVFKKNMRLR